MIVTLLSGNNPKSHIPISQPLIASASLTGLISCSIAQFFNTAEMDSIFYEKFYSQMTKDTFIGMTRVHQRNCNSHQVIMIMLLNSFFIEPFLLNLYYAHTHSILGGIHRER